jgi:hypothetical protein
MIEVDVGVPYGTSGGGALGPLKVLKKVLKNFADLTKRLCGHTKNDNHPPLPAVSAARSGVLRERKLCC